MIDILRSESSHDRPLEAPVIIEPSRGWVHISFAEIWRYRELVLFLAWRDIAVRYKQTAIGVLWAIIQPLTAMVIFSIFFGRFAHMPSEGVPYPVFTYAALLPWQYFATAITDASQSMLTNERLLTKVYFPRLIIPVASALPAVIDFVLSFLLFLGIMLAYGTPITTRIVWLPLLLLLAFAMALGIGLWMSALNVQYRDFRYIVPFLVQTWMFASPVVYSLSIVPDQWRTLYSLNPMVTVIEGFRWALIGSSGVSLAAMVVSVVATAGMLFSGLAYFQHVEDIFADVI
jgi:lipopolysaccharide transport system permease protein